MTQPNELRQEPLGLKEELHIKSFGLHHHTPHDFFRSQWQTELKSSVFLIYRWGLAIYFTAGTISYIIKYFKRGIVFIYLTNWGLILSCITSLSGAIFVTVHHGDTEKMLSHSWIVKFYWACYWTNLILSHIISIIYWSFLHFEHPPTKLIHHIYNIFRHVMPPLLFTVDHMLVAHPSRVLHFVYPLLLLAGYAGFSYIYYKLDGLNHYGLPYIYSMLNYAKPVRTLKTMALAVGVLVCCSILQYGVYRLRVIIARKLDKLQ